MSSSLGRQQVPLRAGPWARCSRRSLRPRWARAGAMTRPGSKSMTPPEAPCRIWRGRTRTPRQSHPPRSYRKRSRSDSLDPPYRVMGLGQGASARVALGGPQSDDADKRASVIPTKCYRLAPMKPRLQAFCAALVLFAAVCAHADEAREATVRRIMEVAALDRLILANARATLATDPKAAQHLDDLMYGVRPPAMWNAKHPAWAPTRKALTELVGQESNAWVQKYWRESALNTHVRELAGSYRAEFLTTVREFAESPAGQAYFGRRLADARAKAGEAMFSLYPQPQGALDKLAVEARRRFDALPAADKARVKTFAEDEGVWLDK